MKCIDGPSKKDEIDLNAGSNDPCLIIRHGSFDHDPLPDEDDKLCGVRFMPGKAGRSLSSTLSRFEQGWKFLK
uniref:Uncharacterized protein n=1 Tax=Araneus ventricosus TaxID=182803 RepID=A0A4Y2I8M9_ARAVE|nr:hypothetical protein AVEN_15167-1 [Araneus ventricosus]GBM73762.1 hypothetical protein AVEN_41481-1 [Araneus ventricosus]